MTAHEPLTGTYDRPIERIPDAPSTLPDWAALLAGPVIWIVYFGIVYLAAEASCVPAPKDQYDIIGTDALVVLTVVATVVAALAAAGVAWAAGQRMRHRDQHGDEHYVVDLSRAGSITAIGALIGIIAVGAPAVYLNPLC